MSAFGVVTIAVGILMLWSGLKHEKISDVLQGFVGAPTAKTASAVSGTTGQVAQLDSATNLPPPPNTAVTGQTTVVVPGGGRLS